MADPDNHPGLRPLTREERLIAFVSDRCRLLLMPCSSDLLLSLPKLDLLDEGDELLDEFQPPSPSQPLFSPRGNRDLDQPLPGLPLPLNDLAPKEGASLLVGWLYQAQVLSEPRDRVEGEMLTKEERMVMGEVVQMGLGLRAEGGGQVKEGIVASCRQGLSTSLDLLSRHTVMDATIREMDAELLGPGEVRALGMHLLGSKARALWCEEDEGAFALGIKEHDREFELIQRDYLPHKAMSELIAYYYNVWKTRATPAADSHHIARRAKKDKAKVSSP